MAWKLSNFADGTLAQAAADSDTTIYVTPALAALLPTLGVGDKAKAVIFNSSQKEIVNVTAVDLSGALTVQRAQESTSAYDWSSGTRVVHTPTAEILQLVLAATAEALFFGTSTLTGAEYEIDVGASNPVPSLSDGEEIIFLVDTTSPDGPLTLVVTDGTTPTTSKPFLNADGSEFNLGDVADGWLVKATFSGALDAWLLTTHSSYHVYASEVNTDAVPGVSRHRNGKLDFWNNGTSFVTPVSGTETADGWIAEYDGTIGAFTVSRQAFVLGQTDVPGNPKYWLRWNQSNAGSGSSFRRLRVPLPGVHWRQGEDFIRRVWLKAGTNLNVTGRIRQNFGTGGSPSPSVDIDEVFALTTDWQAFDIVDTLASVSGKTLGSADDSIDLILELPVNVTMTIDVAQDDIRPGSIPGRQSDSYPLPWWLGGTGGSWLNASDFIAGLGLFDAAAFNAYFAANFPDLSAIEPLATTGALFRTGAATWALRNLAVGSGLSVVNPAGVAGDPTINLGTALANYVADPLSVAELASVTGTFGTAAFVAANTLALQATVLTAGLGISGGGDLSANRSFAFDPTELTDTAIVSADSLVFLDATDSLPKRRLVSSLVSDLSLAVTNASQAFTAQQTMRVTSAGAATTPLILQNVSATANTEVVLRFDPSSAGTRYGEIAFRNDGSNNISAYIRPSSGGSLVDAVTITPTGDVVLLNSLAMSSDYSAGFGGVPVISGNSAYAFPLTEGRGYCIYHDEVGTRTYTIPANASVAHRIGTTFVIDNTGNSGAAGAITLAITSDTLRRGDGTSGTGSRTISAGQVAIIRKVASTIWIITGTFS